jgi:hypothetical protein
MLTAGRKIPPRPIHDQLERICLFDFIIDTFCGDFAAGEPFGL